MACTGKTSIPSQCSSSQQCPHLVFGHGTEVVVPEEDAELPLLDSGGKLTQAVVGQLGGCAVEELFRHVACGSQRECVLSKVCWKTVLCSPWI